MHRPGFILHAFRHRRAPFEDRDRALRTTSIVT
jgi:hypothetical protein